jgi:GDP-4-dehydro-6-deoxy-D-mannose reductase
VRALVTGAGGFVGQWLCRELLSDGWDVHGATLTGAPASGSLDDWQRDAVYWHDADLRDRVEVETVLDEARPEAVFHLAGVAHVPSAGTDPATAWSTNVMIAVNLLDAIGVRRGSGTMDPAIVIAGSAAQYGAHPPASMPLPEGAAQIPMTVYGATKAAQEIAALAAWRSAGVRVVAARAFNHSGPGQGTAFLLPALVERVVEARQSKASFIRVGNTTPVRDFLHVQDVARAYIYLALRGRPGEAYNIASGVGTSVAQLAEIVIDQLNVTLRLEPDTDLTRPNDVPALIGDPTKLSTDTSWTSHHTLDTMIGDLIDAAAF